MGLSSMYQLELERQQQLRDQQSRVRDDDAGFVGQSGWGSAAAGENTVDPAATPGAEGDYSPAAENAAKAQAFGDLFDAIMAGTAPAAALDRATRCAMDCAKMTGRPVGQFLTDAARTVASSIIYGD